MASGDWVCERYAEARRSSTMVLSSRIASSTSVFVRRREPGRDGAVLDRPRDGDGKRERTRAGERAPEVLERRMVGFSMMEAAELVGSSIHTESVGVCIVAIVVPERRRSVAVLFWLCTLERLECEIEAEEEVTGLR